MPSLNQTAHLRSTMRLALFEPDIPQNAGAMLRLAACLGIAVDLVEPCGFVLSDRRLRRAGLDYLDKVTLSRHPSWEAYQTARAASGAGRLILLSSRAEVSYLDFSFRPDDTILVGRETAGVPEEVHETADARLRVPMRAGLRSLNVALSAAMVLGEALRQTGHFPAILPALVGALGGL